MVGECHCERVQLVSNIVQDETTAQISEIFDYAPPEGKVIVDITIPTLPDEYQIGLIVGSSGSGKSTILKTVFGRTGEEVSWDNSKCIASNFKSFDDASSRFGAVGLNSIPTWLKPRCALSNGEGFRADLAMALHDGAVVDEFTSVVNREVALSCCVSIEKYIRNSGMKNVTFASCHDDIIQYLRPDWVYNTDTHEFYSGRYLCRPKINIAIVGCTVQAWDMFKRHHYLSGSINKSAQCYLGIYNGIPVAFGAIIAMPCGTLRHAFREHRVVVLPDYQGMGIGNKFSEAIAEAYHNAGCRYFSKTANPRMGEHRERSDRWKPTSKNRAKRRDYLGMTKDYHGMLENALVHANRSCFSHEYVGDGVTHNFRYGDAFGEC